MNKIVHKDMRAANTPRPDTPKPESFVVDDFSGGVLDDLDTELAQFGEPVKEEPKMEKPKVEFKLPEKQPVSKVLEKLVFIGRLSKEIEISGVSFELSTLTNKENNDVVNAMYSFSGRDVSYMLATRVVTLAHAVRKIDGQPIEDIDIPGDFKTEFHKKMSIIDNLQYSVVEKLYDEYSELLVEKEEASNDGEAIKNS